MNSIEKLIQIFSYFPGIGPRQAKRFVYYLLTRNNNSIEELSKNLLELKENVIVCEDCMRFFQKRHSDIRFCNICSDQNRDNSLLMLVQRDVDLESVEKNGGFRGTYFVLGGSIPVLEKEPEKKIRMNELKVFIEKKIKEGLNEIILATNWNPEGENTSDYIAKILEPILNKNKIKLSHLGKGLSMGIELEYADGDTLKNALKNRG